MKKSTAIITGVCTLLAVALAIAAVIVVVKTTKTVVSNEIYASSANEISLADDDTLSSPPPQNDLTEAPQPPQIPLVITSPQKNDVSVSESHFAITGTSDKNKPLIMNGNAVQRLESGEFSIDVELKPGKNIFNFEYDNQTVSYVIRYNFVVIKAYAPYEKQSYEAGSSFVAVAYARVNSSSV